MKSIFDLLQNQEGVIVGRVTTQGRPLNKREREYCSRFVETVSKGRKEVETVSDNMKANVTALAGEIKKLSIEKRDDGKPPKRGGMLLDCGPESNRGKWVRCTVFDDEALAGKLARFAEGDYIRIKGHVRVWSQKSEAHATGWEQNTEVRIEEIKDDPPKREKVNAASKAFGGDDGLPW